MNYLKMKFTALKYRPPLDGPMNDFVGTISTWKLHPDEGFVIEVPEVIRDTVGKLTPVENPMLVFMPRYEGDQELLSNPRDCVGYIAVQGIVNADGVERAEDFSMAIQCFAMPLP